MGFPSFAEIRRQRVAAEAEVADARAAGDDKALRTATTQLKCVDWLAGLVSTGAARWLDAVVASYGEDPVDIRAGLKKSIGELERGRLEALARGDRLSAERGAEGKVFVEKRLAVLSRQTELKAGRKPVRCPHVRLVERRDRVGTLITERASRNT